MAYRFEGPHTAVSERSQTITKVKTRMTSGQRNRQRHQLQELVEASSGQALLEIRNTHWIGRASPRSLSLSLSVNLSLSFSVESINQHVNKEHNNNKTRCNWPGYKTLEDGASQECNL